MNRKINFRAWDTDKNVFVDPKDHYISQINADYGGLGNRFIYEQFTGLLDDNEKKIHEGDIIIDINGIEHTVQWNDDTCKFQLSDGSDLNDGDRYGTYKCIVGNIHEQKL